MKKLILNLAIIGMMTGVSMAAEDKSFFGQIKSLFVKDIAPQVQVQIAAPQSSMKASLMISATVTASTTAETEDVSTSTETYI